MNLVLGPIGTSSQSRTWTCSHFPPVTYIFSSRPADQIDRQGEGSPGCGSRSLGVPTLILTVPTVFPVLGSGGDWGGEGGLSHMVAIDGQNCVWMRFLAEILTLRWPQLQST